MKRQILISSIILLSIQTFASAKTLYVPSRNCPTIQSAITAAVNGDVVVVAPGVYTGTGNIKLDFGGRAITVKSNINPANPDPAIIAATIIDCGGQPAAPSAGGPAAANRAFWFHNSEGLNSIVMGFTIRNGYARGLKGADGSPGYIGKTYSDFKPIPTCTDPCNCPPYALSGKDATGNGYGGAILCGDPTNPASFASPTIRYCVIENCTVTGAQGGNGADGNDGPWSHYVLSDFNFVPGGPNYHQLLLDAVPTQDLGGQWAGKGGKGSGNGFGGAIACLGGSNPDINTCTISNNFARGGRGGDGGNGGDAASTGSPPTYQGNESGGGDANNSVGDGRGGAIYCDGSSNPTIRNCIFSNNVATTGPRGTGGQRGLGSETNPRAPDGNDGFVYSSGGIAGGAAYYDTGSHVNGTNCTFTGNKTYEAYQVYQSYYGEDIWRYTIGGALYSNANNIIALDTCTFTGNLGGAVYCGTGCTVNINNTYDPNRSCLFSNNSETTSGGALYIDTGCTVNLQSCIFGGNSAYDDGGALECRSNATITSCSFSNNKADSDNDGYGYGGAMDAYEPSGTTLTIDVNGCSFVGNQAIYGGGFSSDNFHNTRFTNCYFIDNTAREGGGLDMVTGDFSVIGGVVKGNNTTNGDGGGFDCIATTADINGCTISDNFADGNYPTGGNGGAIMFFSGDPSLTQKVFNCLITGNSAAVDGGAIFCNYAAPNIGNCTFSGNSADSYGGAVFSDYASEPNITDCIFEGCNNHAIHEEVFGGDAIVRYSLFYNNPDRDYYESDTFTSYNFGSVADPNGNFNGDPLFVSGLLGNFYLNQTSSPAINSGSNTAAYLGLNTYTTDANNAPDSGQVDRGYHYPISTSVQTFHLTASVVGDHGSITPTSGTYYAGTVVTLTAAPNSGWRIKAWSGTDDVSSTAKTNSVVMNSDKSVTVEFEQGRTLIVAAGGGQPGYYSNIQDAVSDANNGDTIVVYPGIYYGGYEAISAYVDKSVTITSLHPDDPCCVAATVIDGYRQSPFNEGYTNIGVVFGPHTNTDTIFDGFTVQNCGGHVGDGLNGDRTKNHPNGYDGGNGYGAALMVFSGGGPVIKNCIIRNNVIIGGNGGNGVAADTTHNAGRGGWGGYAYGGAIYCDVNSSWTFINCQIIDNYVQGGHGGNGGNAMIDGGYANYGGNWSITGTPEYPAVDIDPGSLSQNYVNDKGLWEVWGYIGDYRWYSAFGGGVFCNTGSTVTFVHCTISGNRTLGGVSGQGGQEAYTLRPEEPLIPYELPTFGGGVYCAAGSTITFTDCTITNNTASEPNENNNHLDPYLGHGGGVCAEDTAKLTFTNCTFSENTANVGGGTHFANSNPTISDCNFISNSAFQGGGLFGEQGPVSIIDCNIINNKAVSDNPNIVILGDGGGLHLWATEANIIDCNISGNQAEDSGGGAFFGGENACSLTNCLLTNNTATEGGAVSTNLFAQLAISNCTIAGNTGTTYGGGLNCSYGSYANIINSIIWGNTGIPGSQIAIGIGFEYDPSPSMVDVDYSDIEGAQTDVFVDASCTLNWGTHNIYDDPLFVAGYYLSHKATGQLVDSNAIDAGSDLASRLGLDTYTTRVDGVPDDPNSRVDMGYHYRQGVPPYKLTIGVVGGNGTTVNPSPGVYDVNQDATVRLQALPDPNYTVKKWTGTDDDSILDSNNTVTMYSDRTVTVEFVKEFCQLTIEAGPGGTVASPWSPGVYTVAANTVVNLEAVPNEGYRVKDWSGTNNDTSISLYNTVTADSDKTVRVEFEQPQTITVPGNYIDIQSAIGAARPGDVVKVASGVHNGSHIVVDKEVTITSTNPDDPYVVAATIIDSSGYADTAVVFYPGATQNTVFDGFTIKGGTYNPIDARDANGTGQNGEDGYSIGGGAVYIDSGASPTIKNCVISNTNITGGNAGNGGNADATVDAGRGGWAGGSYGGGIFISSNANPTLVNCTITNCVVRGGNAGNGGNSAGTYGDASYHDANHGGSWSNDETFPWQSLVGSNGQPYLGDYWYYGGLGGGVFCAPNSSATFKACNITNNMAFGGMSGIGGTRPWVRPDPVTAYRIPSYGGGVYCANDTNVRFIDCNITGNTAPRPDGTYHIDPYLGHGGGVAFGQTAHIEFTNCNITDNNAAVGGGMYWMGGDPQVIDCNIAGNTAYVGGGTYGTKSTGLIQGCTIHDNFAGVSSNDVDTNAIGQGGGIYSASMESQIVDCTIIDNNAATSGGGILFAGVEANTPMVKNCLVVDNQAGRDGGGLSINWYAAPLITNCTVVGNEATGNFGVPGRTGLGGGIYSSYHSHPVILNSILWNNYALQGSEIAVGTGFEYDLLPSTVDIDYSDIRGAQVNVFVDVNCTLNWGSHNIYADPCFVTGPLGNYYLSQTDTNDHNQTIDSNCVDAGNDLAINVGLYHSYTTRTDEVFDTGIVDMGYHYPLAHPIESCSFSDLNHDGIVNFTDFAIFSLYWLNEGCSNSNNWCGGADLTSDTHVDFNDLASLYECWLAEDTDAPLPNPSQWEIQPYSTTVIPPYTISMTAKAAYDAWGGVVEYYFECVTCGNDSNSGWDPNRIYISTNLDPNTVYGYRVKARDVRGNETLWSAVGYAIAGAGEGQGPSPVEDHSPPTPVTWASVPTAIDSTSITMTATTATDSTPPVEYYFECTNYGDANSNWQTNPTYVATGLTPSTQYTFRFKARDSAAAHNETGWSDPRSATTPATSPPQDTTPPLPSTSQWAVAPTEYGPDTNGYYHHTMTAVVTDDASTGGSNPCEYYFEFVTGGYGPHDSGWQQSNVYDYPVSQSHQYGVYRVRARDASPLIPNDGTGERGNKTNWSSECSTSGTCE